MSYARNVFFLALMLTLAFTLPQLAFAFGPGGGKGNPGGPGDGPGGNGPVADITSGTPFTYTGEVIEMFGRGGVNLATADVNADIIGMAPPEYWDENGVTAPELGDTITVEGYAVDFNETTKNVAMAVTVDGATLQLRDSETGEPLWRKGGGFEDIRGGDFFAYAGTIISMNRRFGVTLATDTDGEVSVYGLGPQCYWEEQGVSYPQVDDYLEAEGYVVTRGDIVRNMLSAVSVNGAHLQLMDTDTGLPLWAEGPCEVERPGGGERPGRPGAGEYPGQDEWAEQAI